MNGRRIAYSYPAGWALKQDTNNGFSRVSLSGPDGALQTLTLYSAGMNPAQLAASLLDGMKQKFPDATATPLTGTIGGFPAQGYTMKFTYMGVPMTSTILAFCGGPFCFTLYTQAADEDWSNLQPAFDVLKSTLVVQ